MPQTAAISPAPLTEREEDAQLRLDFAAFAQRCFRELNRWSSPKSTSARSRRDHLPAVIFRC
jgi:hypothetical protein